MIVTKKPETIRMTLIHLLFIFFCSICLIPFLLVISTSFSDEMTVMQHGFKLIPMQFSLDGYNYILSYPKHIIDAYGVTTITSFVGTFLSVLIMVMVAYPLSRTSFRYRRFLMFYFFFTTLFSGGLVPSYLLITNYLKLQNTLWVMILPGLINVFHIILLRTFFKQLPTSIIESAKMDGASEFMILFRIILPLAKPVIATVALFGVLGRWNEWYSALLYIQKQELVPLQYLLQRILINMEYLQRNPMAQQFIKGDTIPGETARLAMVVVTTGPMIFVFPFFQKYFVKGMTVGSLKG